MGRRVAHCNRFHHRSEIRVNQNARNRNGQKHICFKFFCRRCRHHNRKKIEGSISDRIDYAIRFRIRMKNTSHSQEHYQKLYHGAANNGRNQRRHRSHNGIQNIVSDFFQSQRLLLLSFCNLTLLTKISQF